MEEHFKRSDVVFLGKVESISNAPETYNIRWEDPEDNAVLETPTTEVALKVENVWKGKLNKEVQVYTTHGSYSTASFPFEDQSRYVVFAEFSKAEEHSEEAEPHLRTAFCSGNIGLGDGKSDVDLDELLINTDWRDLGDLGNETTLVERLEKISLKLEDKKSTEQVGEDTKQNSDSAGSDRLD